MKMKKIIIIILVSLLLLIGILIGGYYLGLSSVSTKDREVKFVIESGRGAKNIVSDLKNAGLIRSELASLIYLWLNQDILIQAGEYVLNENMSTKEIFATLQSGKVYNDSISITFIEGEVFKKYIKNISDAYELNEEEVLNILSNQEFLQGLIDKYWFIDESILSDGIYYPLEGYLYPNTYSFHKSSTAEEIIIKILDETDKILSKYKEQIEASEYSPHEILTMASIIEKEAIVESDRAMVSQVIYKRLSIPMNLGMDVTSYYGVQKDMKETITKADLNDNNAYNTRLQSFLGLPIGPICNPSESSIKAALNPSETNYIYFFADIATGKVYFTEDYNEFLTFKEIYG